MAVAVEEHLRGPGGEVELHPPRFAFVLEELFEQDRSAGDLQRPALSVVAQQRGDIFFDRRQAAGLQEHDGHAALGERIQPVHAAGRLAPGRRQQTLRNQRPPAARERCELDVEPGDLEDLQSRHADIRSVVVGERIVEERSGGGSRRAPALLVKPPREWPRRPCRRHAAPIQPEKFLVEPARECAAGDGVRQRREPAAPSRHLVNVSEQVRAERSTVTAPVVGEKLALEAGDVHADGTLGLAGPAFETQIEHLPYALVTQPRFADPPRHGQAQNVRTPSRRVRLFPRGHV